MTTPTEPRPEDTQSASDPERAAASATQHRSRGTRFSSVAQGATSRVRGSARKVTGLTTAASAGVGPKVAAPSDLAANTAQTVSSTATKTAGSTARTATKTAGSTVRTATKAVGSTARTATKAVGSSVAFSFLVARAMLLLELIKRIALLVIEALRDLARRLRERYGIETGHSAKADGQGSGPVPV
jgi:hypothetical protein